MIFPSPEAQPLYPQPVFRDRAEAGRCLAQLLTAYSGRDDVVVLALPRGGVPVAYQVAGALPAPLDVFTVRKLGAPGHRELAMGAIASGGVRVLNDEVVEMMRIPPPVIDAVTLREQEELRRRERAYRDDLPAPTVQDRTVILIDDGLATGSTMRAALLALRALHPSRIVVAAPVAAADTCAELAPLADDIVCAVTPEDFRAVGLWYDDFSPVSDDEVRALLQASKSRDGKGR